MHHSVVRAVIRAFKKSHILDAQRYDMAAVSNSTVDTSKLTSLSHGHTSVHAQPRQLSATQPKVHLHVAPPLCIAAVTSSSDPASKRLLQALHMLCRCCSLTWGGHTKSGSFLRVSLVGMDDLGGEGASRLNFCLTPSGILASLRVSELMVTQVLHGGTAAGCAHASQAAAELFLKQHMTGYCTESKRRGCRLYTQLLACALQLLTAGSKLPVTTVGLTCTNGTVQVVTVGYR